MTEHSYPLAQPMMVCPCCEERWCLVRQMEAVRDIVWSPLLWSAPTYYLLAECPCGASWAGVYEEGA
jgi:hypothetical protein